MREQPPSSDVDIVVGTPVIAATVVNLDLSDLTEDQSVVILLRMDDLGVSEHHCHVCQIAWRILTLRLMVACLVSTECDSYSDQMRVI